MAALSHCRLKPTYRRRAVISFLKTHIVYSKFDPFEQYTWKLSLEKILQQHQKILFHGMWINSKTDKLASDPGHRECQVNPASLVFLVAYVQ